MDSVQQIYATNQTPLSQTFRASYMNLMNDGQMDGGNENPIQH